MNEGITLRANGDLSSVSGKDGMMLMQVLTIKRALDFYAATNGRMTLTRVATPKNMMAMAGRYTGKAYKNTPKGRAECSADLNVWIENMKSAIPVTVES